MVFPKVFLVSWNSARRLWVQPPGVVLLWYVLMPPWRRDETPSGEVNGLLGRDVAGIGRSGVMALLWVFCTNSIRWFLLSLLLLWPTSARDRKSFFAFPKLLLVECKSFGYYCFARYSHVWALIQGEKQTQSAFSVPCWCSISSACIFRRNTDKA